MGQTEAGAMKQAAKRIGIPVEEYTLHRKLGEKWCCRCKTWKTPREFGIDRSQKDGRSSKCIECRRDREKERPRGIFKHSEEARAHIRETWESRKDTFTPPMKGKKHSELTLQRMHKPKRSSGRVGKKHTLKARAKMSQVIRARALRGEQCHSYKDGKLAERRNQRFSQAYKRWRYDVFLRDHFTCQDCGDSRGGNLVAHHIKAFANYPDLRFEVSNGLTLCKSCHAKRHEKGQDNGERHKDLLG